MRVLPVVARKSYKFYNDWSVVLGHIQGERLKHVNPKHEDWASIQFLTLSVLYFMFILPKQMHI